MSIHWNAHPHFSTVFEIYHNCLSQLPRELSERFSPRFHAVDSTMQKLSPDMFDGTLQIDIAAKTLIPDVNKLQSLGFGKVHLGEGTSAYMAVNPLNILSYYPETFFETPIPNFYSTQDYEQIRQIWERNFTFHEKAHSVQRENNLDQLTLALHIEQPKETRSYSEGLREIANPQNPDFNFKKISNWTEIGIRLPCQKQDFEKALISNPDVLPAISPELCDFLILDSLNELNALPYTLAEPRTHKFFEAIQKRANRELAFINRLLQHRETLKTE